jgi:hypothetical protein
VTGAHLHSRLNRLARLVPKPPCSCESHPEFFTPRIVEAEDPASKEPMPQYPRCGRRTIMIVVTRTSRHINGM